MRPPMQVSDTTRINGEATNASQRSHKHKMDEVTRINLEAKLQGF